MASFMFKTFVVLCLCLLWELPCNGDSIVAWNVWKVARTVCGHSVKDLPKSLQTELKHHPNTTEASLSTKRTDRLVVKYDDFRCCMKKTWVSEMDFDTVQRGCLRNLMKCILAAGEKPCTLGRLDYMLLIISDDGIIVLSSFTLMVVGITWVVLKQMHKDFSN